jgi:signal transduction histidine kinase
MAYRSEIIRALDELMADEVGMRFQGIAVVHAKRKWPQLVACERKWDGGLDAHADGTLERNGKGIGLASSTTPTIAKIKHDAKNTKKHYPDVKVLIFSTAGPVTEHQKKPWVEEIQRDFGLDLIVVSREEFITWLLDPTQSDICRDQLGIPVSMPTELEPVLESAQGAAKETVDKWDHWYRKPGRPLINLAATKLNERGEPVEAAATDSLAAGFEEGQRIVLEAPAGSGKTTALVQFARRILSGGGLAFLVDLPEWVSSHRNILAFVADYPAFAARGLDAALLSKLRGKQPPTFLLNGWNEVAIANAAAADAALRDLERTFPASTIVVTTRLHRLIPPLRNVLRVQLNQLDRAKRNEYLDRALGTAAHDLKVKLNSNRTLDSITRTPLILAEVADLHRAGKEIPPTKMGVLGAVLHEIEQSAEHRIPLQQAPLRGHAANYLHALSMKMTELGETTIADSDARVVVNSVSDSLRVEGRIMSPPDPGEVLDELAKRHVLVPSHQGDFTFRFQHQQFQEFYAAEGLRRLLLGVVDQNDPERKFAKEYVNEPKWGESLRMLAEYIAARGTRTEFVEGGARLIRMALHVDPIFVADLANASGPAVWARVRGDVGKRLRDLYAQKDPHYRHCALAAMLVTESDDFKDIIVPLLAHPDAQVRLGVYHSGTEVLPGSLGPNWRDLVRSWPEEARLNFVGELGHNPWFSDSVEELAFDDPSPRVKWTAAQMFGCYGFVEKAERLLKSINDASLPELVRMSQPDEIPSSQWPRVVKAYEQMYKEAGDPLGRLRFLYSLEAFGGTNVIGRMIAELDALGPDQLTSRDNESLIRWALDKVQQSDSKWVSEWATRKVLDTSIWTGDWRGLITEIPNHEAEELYSRFVSEVLAEGEQRRVVSVLIPVMNAELAARAFGRACEIYSGLSFPPGHDQAKWNLFGQVKDLLRAVSPAMLLDGISEELNKEPQANELDVLTDTLPATKLTNPDTRSSIPEGMRAKLRAYLKRGAKLGFDPDGIRASARARLAQLLANVGEQEDIEDIRHLIEADTVRWERAQAARMKGDRSQDVTGYGFLYLDAG